MSFYQIKLKLKQGIYLENPDDLESDIKLIFVNAKNYNFPSHKIYKEAVATEEICGKLFEKYKSAFYKIALEYYIFDRNTPINFNLSL